MQSLSKTKQKLIQSVTFCVWPFFYREMLSEQFSEQQWPNKDITYYTICTNNYTSFKYSSFFSRHHKGDFTFWAHATPININESYSHVQDGQYISWESQHSSYLVWGNNRNVTKAEPNSRRIQPLNCHAWLSISHHLLLPQLLMKHDCGATHHAPEHHISVSNLPWSWSCSRLHLANPHSLHVGNEWQSLTGDPVSQIQIWCKFPDCSFYFGPFQILCPLKIQHHS